MVSRNCFSLRAVALIAACAASLAAQSVTGAQRVVDALSLQNAGRYADAQTILDDLRLRSERGEAGSPPLGQVLDCVGVNQMAMGHYVDAEKSLSRSVTLFRRDNDARNLAIATGHLAELYMEQRRGDEAEPLLREARPGLNGLNLALLVDDLGILAAWKGRYSEAAGLFRQSIGLLESEYGPADPRIETSLFSLAFVLTKEHRFDDAVATANRARDIVLQGSPKVNPPEIVGAMHAVAAVYLQAGRAREARPYVERAIELAEKIYGPVHPKLAIYLTTYSEILKRTGAKGEAKKAAARAAAIADEMQRTNPTHLTVNINALR